MFQMSRRNSAMKIPYPDIPLSFCRKYLFGLLLLWLVAIPARAQWSAGGKAGVNWSTVRYPKNILNDKAGFITGGQAGIVVAYQFNRYFDMQAELLYATHGYKDDNLYLNYDGNASQKGYSCRIHYIEIPLLVKYYPVAGFNIQAGPQLGIGVSLSDSWQEAADFQQQAKTEFGVVFGLGYEFDFGGFVDARYNLGLTRSIRGAESGYEGRNINISVGYRLYL